ncbi:MAG: sulfite reductase subunit A [Alphaproteobacteria bacterium]|nr:sulfite reductase subunit A [Alphaproteobacteria bacterium]
MADHHGAYCIDRPDFGSLFSALKKRGYSLVGPTVQDGAIVFDEIEAVDDLPEGWTDEQDAGTYRIRKRDDKALFGFNSGPHSWKKFLYPSETKLWSARRTEDGFEIEEGEKTIPQYAFIGVHPCDLRAIEIQDKIFMAPDTADPRYGRKREAAFVIALNCGQASKTCFCTSMGTGPRAESGFDIALTEIMGEGYHYFLAESGSERGHDVLRESGCRSAADIDFESAAKVSRQAVDGQIRAIDTNGIKEMLYRNYENKHWEDVAERCMSCANCTLVCPTCFCSKTEDEMSLDGEIADRWRYWDSCFTLDFSYIHGGTIRQTIRSRYRQWMTHKLAAWYDQFGSSGCVGCGRCIAWCPVGIDITAEVKALRESEGGKKNG